MTERRDPAAEAVRLRDEMRGALGRWLEQRGVTAPVVISGYVTSTGQPALSIQLNAYLAATIITSITEQVTPPQASPHAAPSRAAEPPTDGERGMWQQGRPPYRNR